VAVPLEPEVVFSADERLLDGLPVCGVDEDPADDAEDDDPAAEEEEEDDDGVVSLGEVVVVVVVVAVVVLVEEEEDEDEDEDEDEAPGIRGLLERVAELTGERSACVDLDRCLLR